MRLVDYTDRKIGHLTVNNRISDKIYEKGIRVAQWACTCICGKELVMLAARLRQPESNLSCGCKNFTRMHKNTKHSPQLASFLSLFNRMKQGAQRRHKEFNITFEKFKEVVTSPCIWCKKDPFDQYNSAISKNGWTLTKHAKFKIEHGWVTYNGLDRIDNNRGYTEDNIASCCKYCNFARNDRTPEEFHKWLVEIATIYKDEIRSIIPEKI
jgi:hypothetical protein